MPLPRTQADGFFERPAAEKHDDPAAGPSTLDPKASNYEQPHTPDKLYAMPTMPTAIPDFAQNINAPVPGWPLLAKVMGDNPAFKVFPTFSDLNMKSLLYYQAELVSLREELHSAEYRDYRLPRVEDGSLFANSIAFLLDSKDDDSQPPPEQWVIMTKIRQTLREYSEYTLMI
jgi:hypothetical protein